MLFGETNSPSILILNEFDSNTDNLKLSEFFPNKNFSLIKISTKSKFNFFFVS